MGGGGAGGSMEKFNIQLNNQPNIQTYGHYGD